jgi:hypothetical protein
MAEIVYGLPIDYKRLANDAHLGAQFVREVIDVHAERVGGPVLRSTNTHRSGRLLKFDKERLEG